MQVSHIFIHGDNINSLCDFYSFVFDCEIELTEADPFIMFDSYKFVFKKVLGNRANILPSFALAMDSAEADALNQRLELFLYKSGLEYDSGNLHEIKDPCGNIFLINKVDSKENSSQIVRNC